MLKQPYLLTQVFEYSEKKQEKLFKHMYNFGAREVCSNGIRDVSSYLYGETRKYQYCLLNTNSLDCITGYIMDSAVGDNNLKRLTQIRLNLIYGSTSSYCSIIKSSGWVDMIDQAKKLASVLGDIYSEHLESR